MTVVLVFLFAFLIRLINLNQSLWLDEAIVAKVVKTIPLLQIPFQFSPGDFHPPLYYMFMSLWTGVFGHSEIALRMPSVLFSLIAGWFVFKTALLIKDRKTGLWAAAFFLFNPLIIYYSQEARMYMMTTAFLSITLYYFVRITKATSWLRSDMVLFNLFSALALFTFYGSVFFIVTMLIVRCIVIPVKTGIQEKNKRGILIDWIHPCGCRPAGACTELVECAGMTWGLLISLLLLSPLLIQQLHNAKTVLSEVTNWSLVLGKAEIKNVAMIFLKFTTGRLSWYPKWSYYLVAGISTAITWLLVVFGMTKNKVFAFLFFFPLCIGLIVSFIAPMMMYFRFLYLVPVMSILLGLGVISTKTSDLEVAWRDLKDRDFSTSQSFARNDTKGIITILLFLVFSFIYLFNSQFHREDWRKMVQNIDPMQPVYMILPSSDPVNYYNPTLPLFEMRGMQKTILPEHIQIIPYVEEIYGYNHAVVLEKKGCMRETQSEYRGPLLLEKWRCPPSFVGHVGVGAI